ncbi:MAG: hypothetical protein GY765_38005 [bacterium]|nr:hypothetical protein [bacterium]
MGSDDYFLNSLTHWLAGVDDEYLITISNKGIFKRSHKELAAGMQVEVRVNEDHLETELSDGTICRFTANAKDSSCTCPSRGMCKHRMISILYLKANPTALRATEENGPGSSRNDEGKDNGAGSKGNLEKEPRKEDFSAVLALDTGQLKKLVSPVEMKTILLRLQYGVSVEIRRKFFLTITFKEEGISCNFPSQNPLQDSVCSCKAAGICVHRVEALFHYLCAEGAVTLEALKSSSEPEIPVVLLQEVRKLVERIMLPGLSRLPASVLHDIGQMAIAAGTNGIHNIENQLRGVMGELESHFKKSASFSRQAVLDRLIRLYSLVEILLERSRTAGKSDSPLKVETVGQAPETGAKEKSNRRAKHANPNASNVGQSTTGPKGKPALVNLLGENRSTYFDIPPLEITGLGAEAWTTRSAYAGITCYFYCPGRAELFTFSFSRPEFYDNVSVNFNRLHLGEAPWNTGLTLNECSKSVIALEKAKINSSYRLSSSGETKGKRTQRSEPADFRRLPVFFDNWLTLKESLKPRFASWLFPPQNRSRPLVIGGVRWGDSVFDKVAQVLTCPLYDAEDNVLQLMVHYGPQGKPVMENIERMESGGSRTKQKSQAPGRRIRETRAAPKKKEEKPGMLLVRPFYHMGRLCVFPITAYFPDGSIVNWTVENEN